MADQRIIVALDVSTTSELKDLVAQIPNKHCRVKVGKELFTSVGPLAVDICHGAGLDVFLDLKFHDIPNTCAKAVLAAARLGVWMTNVHCAGGADMMRATTSRGTLVSTPASSTLPSFVTRTKSSSTTVTSPTRTI